MKRLGRVFAACVGLLPGLVFADAALAQKQGGVLRVFHRDSPASMSILEEGSISAIMPMMGVFNNLVHFDQHVPQNRVESIVPDLATSWSLSEDATELMASLPTRAAMASGTFTASAAGTTAMARRAIPRSGKESAAVFHGPPADGEPQRSGRRRGDHNRLPAMPSEERRWH
jgi:hypothetical protein